MKVAAILLITTCLALTCARPTFDKIAEAIIDVLDDEVHSYRHGYPPAHPHYQHGYPAGPIVVGQYQQPYPHTGYPNRYPPPPPGSYYPPNYNGNYDGYHGYQQPPYGHAQYGGPYQQPRYTHNHHRGYK